jgi:hypothetical protein
MHAMWVQGSSVRPALPSLLGGEDLKFEGAASCPRTAASTPACARPGSPCSSPPGAP